MFGVKNSLKNVYINVKTQMPGNVAYGLLGYASTSMWKVNKFIFYYPHPHVKIASVFSCGKNHLKTEFDKGFY